MRTSFAAAAALLSAVQYASGQTFTDCNPTQKSCPADPALGTTYVTDFRNGADDFWKPADGTTVTYDKTLGAVFSIAKDGQDPTFSSSKYIMFGKVSVVARSAPGVGIVSSFILESDDLDEIDWEWLGGVDNQVQSNFYGKGNTTSYNRVGYENVATPEENFHTYTVEWTSSAITWSIDNTAVRTLAYGDPLAVYGQNYPQTPMMVKFGSWIGCASAAAASDPKTAGTCSWAGGPVQWGNGPFNMYVQTITIEDYGCATTYSYGDMSGSYQSIKSNGGCKGGVTTGSGSGAGSSSSSSSKAASSSAPATSSKHTSTKATSTKPATSSTAAPSSTSAPASSVASTGNVHPSSTSGSSPLPSHNAASQLKAVGAMDYAIGALGLGLGYLVM